MVFQDYALYPHMNVADNIAFGLRMHGVPHRQRSERVREVARLLQLEPYLDRKPKALSGGQRQRVAMGRALARQARLFLFDEPLSNLDAKLRLEVRTQIKLLHRELGMTTVFVTHDQTEAMTLADRIVCLDQGRIAQADTPDALYNAPANTFVATFIGSPQINLLEAKLRGSRLTLADGQTLRLHRTSGRSYAERKVLIGIRPEDLTDESRAIGITMADRLSMSFVLPETLGSDTYLLGDIAGTRVTARCSPRFNPKPGEEIEIYADSTKFHLFDPETGLRL
jgi:multiple sugar transport system ATP-binding protein